jgi:uncharacterized protein YqgV (UPF0045/DUF77 family)
MTVRFGDAITANEHLLSEHEMDMNIRVLEGYIEGRVEEKSLMRSLSEIEESAFNRTISENCLRFHEAVRQMKTGELSMKEAKHWMICSVSGIRTAYDAKRAEDSSF